MALPPISTPQYPQVADLPGVPQLSRSPAALVGFDIALATPALQNVLWGSTITEPDWGIFDKSGNLVIQPDNIASFDNRNEWEVSTYPVQRGAFANYNKVNNPFECHVMMTKGKTIGDRAILLGKLEELGKSLDLYDIRTPERTYKDVNISRYEVSRRDQNAAFFLTEVDLYFVEIRETAQQYADSQANTSNALDPSAQNTTNQGAVSPQDVNLKQQNAGVAALAANTRS